MKSSTIIAIAITTALLLQVSPPTATATGTYTIADGEVITQDITADEIILGSSLF